MKNFDRRNLAATLVALFCGLLIFTVLNIPERIGLANNGDFTRVIYPSRISYTDEIHYDRFVPDYEMIISNKSAVHALASLVVPDFSQYKYVTSTMLPVLFSKLLNCLANLVTGQFFSAYNIFWLGLIYTGLYSFSLYLILSAVFRRFGLGAFIYASFVAVFVFCDQGYIAYFHSFYGEALQFISFFLTAGLFLRLWEKTNVSVFDCAVYYFSVMIMAAAKNANMPVGLLFAALPFLLLPRLKFPRKYFFAMASSAGVLLFAFTLIATPKWIERDTNFNAVFSGVLKYSDTPESDLVQLGLDPALSVLKGREAYQENYPVDIESEEFNAQFHRRIGKLKLLSFYLRHPSRLVEAMEISAEHSNYIRPGYLGNFQSPGTYAEQAYRFSLWETLRINLGLNNLWAVLLIFAAALFVCVFECLYNRKELIPISLFAIVFMAAAYNFVIPYIGNGICDLAKHMFGFVHMLDVLLFILIGYIFTRIKRRLMKYFITR